MKSRRLESVRRWLRHKEHAAARILEAAHSERARAMEQLRAIDDLSEEYRALLRARSAAGASAADLGSFHRFLSSLEAARKTQQGRVEAEQQTAARANAFWVRAYTECKGVDLLRDLRADRERRHADKTANREASERHTQKRPKPEL